MRIAARNASAIAESPKKCAITRSRTRPVIRLTRIPSATRDDAPSAVPDFRETRAAEDEPAVLTSQPEARARRGCEMRIRICKTGDTVEINSTGEFKRLSAASKRYGCN